MNTEELTEGLNGLVPFAFGTILICCVGCFGNLLIIVALVCNKKLRSKCTVLMGALAVADLTLCLYYMHISMGILFGQLNISNRLCFIQSTYGIFALFAGNFLIWIVSLDRFLAIKFPHRYGTHH